MGLTESRNDKQQPQNGDGNQNCVVCIVNAMNEGWQTALMAAAFDSDEKLVKDLIERKANVNVGSRFGKTALMYARGLPVLKLLLGAGASVNDKDITG
jgi:ankyrin repeat protein